MFCTLYTSPLGRLALVSDGTALTGLWLEGHGPSARHPAFGTRQDALPVLVQARRWLDAYFAGQRPGPAELPLALAGTPFQQAVYALLRDIPYGVCVTYGELAQEIAWRKGMARMAARAVGGAVGRNPLAIIVPCHRVLGAGGKLTGYAGGIDKKILLLQHEGVDTNKLTAVSDYSLSRRSTRPFRPTW